MKVISVMNRKGGVGKTTTVTNMAALLATEHNLSVTVIDADGQANASTFFGADMRAPGLADWFTEPQSEELICDLLQPTPISGVTVIHASDALDDLDISGGSARHIGRIGALIQAMQDLMIPPDIVLIDCPPSFSVACCAALTASEDVIVPVKPDGYVFSGVAELTRQIERLQKVNPLVRIAGALITFWHNSEAVRAGEAALRESGELPVFQTVIRRTDKVDESTYARQTLDTWSPYSSAGRDYRAFVTEYMLGVIS